MHDNSLNGVIFVLAGLVAFVAACAAGVSALNWGSRKDTVNDSWSYMTKAQRSRFETAVKMSELDVVKKQAPGFVAAVSELKPSVEAMKTGDGKDYGLVTEESLAAYNALQERISKVVTVLLLNSGDMDSDEKFKPLRVDLIKAISDVVAARNKLATEVEKYNSERDDSTYAQRWNIKVLTPIAVGD